MRARKRRMLRRAQALSSPLAALAWRFSLSLLASVTLVSACVTTPLRSQPQPIAAVAPSVNAVASTVSITGSGGATLDRSERRAVVDRVVQQGKPDLMKAQLAAMASYGDVDLYSGNAVRLLVDGPRTFEAMFAAIRNARRSIYLESYIVEDAKIAHELADLLRAKRASGIDVALLYDAVGSIGTDAGFFDALSRSGIKVCKFNPVNPLERFGYWGISHRDHRKILVVDGEVGFTGGINISAVYSSSGSMRPSRNAPPRSDRGWRDTQVEVRGPAVEALVTLLRGTWQSQGCRPALDAPGPSPRAAGTQLVRVVPSTPEDENNRIYALLLSAIQHAQHSVLMTMAYFAPGREMLDALVEAARRGVKVRLILPSISDFSPVLHAGRANYTRLLEAGVEIHELQTAVLHAKTAVIDGVVSTVGSSNMDWRSFVSNNEVNAVVMGEDFGGQMHAVFEQDIAMSQIVTLSQWSQRPYAQRIKEALADLLERLW